MQQTTRAGSELLERWVKMVTLIVTLLVRVACTALVDSLLWFTLNYSAVWQQRTALSVKCG